MRFLAALFLFYLIRKFFQFLLSYGQGPYRQEHVRDFKIKNKSSAKSSAKAAAIDASYTKKSEEEV